jgi:hypothetical protein
MIENKELGLKIAESPREKLVAQAIEAAESRILSTELSLELEKSALIYLRSLQQPNNTV